MNDETYYMDANEIASAINSLDHNYELSATNQFIIRNNINEVLSSSVNELVGTVWDDARTNLQKYDNLLAVSNSVNDLINQTNRECLREVLEYLGSDNTINTADLPKFEEERDSLVKEIELLETENKSLEKVPEKILDGYDNNGNPIYKHNTEWDTAQSKIVTNNDRITNILTPRLQEVNRLIDKINTFYSVVLPNIQSKFLDAEAKIDDFLAKVEQQNRSNAQLKSTGVVKGASILSGIAKAYEAMYDGAFWIDSKIHSWKIGLVAGIDRLLGYDESAAIIDDYNNSYLKSQAEWISVNHVQNTYNGLFTNTEWGKARNEESRIKYDSEEAKEIQDISETAARYSFEAGATLLTGSSCASTAIGALYGIGKTAENAYSNNPNSTIDDATGAIVLKGLIGAAEGNAIGGATLATSGAIKATASILKSPTGALDATERAVNAMISMAEEGTLKGKIIDGVKEAFLSPDNVIQVAATTADSISQKDLTVGKEVKDVFTEYVYDLAANAVGVVSPGTKEVLNFYDGLADSNIFEEIDKRDA